MGDHKKTPTEVTVAFTLRERFALANLFLAADAPEEKAGYRRQRRAMDALDLGAIIDKMEGTRAGEQVYSLEQLNSALIFTLSIENVEVVSEAIEKAASTKRMNGATGRVLWPIVERLDEAKDGRYVLPEGMAGPAKENGQTEAATES